MTTRLRCAGGSRRQRWKAPKATKKSKHERRATDRDCAEQEVEPLPAFVEAPAATELDEHPESDDGSEETEAGGRRGHGHDRGKSHEQQGSDG